MSVGTAKRAGTNWLPPAAAARVANAMIGMRHAQLVDVDAVARVVAAQTAEPRRRRTRR